MAFCGGAEKGGCLKLENSGRLRRLKASKHSDAATK